MEYQDLTSLEEFRSVVELEKQDLVKSISALKDHFSQVSQELGDRMREWKIRSGKPHGVGPAETYKLFKRD